MFKIQEQKIVTYIGTFHMYILGILSQQSFSPIGSISVNEGHVADI